MNPVIVVGSFNVDHVWRCSELPATGATIAGQYMTGPGGKGFNQAVAAARAGAATTFVCALGEDPGGALARDLSAADGIDLRAGASSEPTGTAGIYVDARGRNTIVIGAGANGALDVGHVTADPALYRGAGVLLVQLESPMEAIEAALAMARGAGTTTMLNPAPANAPTSMGLLRLADILTPNETEFAAQLLRHVGERIEPDAVAALDGARLHALCRKLLPHGTVVVTMGSVGVFVSHAEEQPRGDAHAYYRIGAESVSPSDTTGAGDAFNGALAAALARAPEQAFASHVRYANRFAALSTERAGAAASMPRDEEVQARFPG